MGERESCLRPDSCEVEVDLEPSVSEIETSVHMITQKRASVKLNKVE